MLFLDNAECYTRVRIIVLSNKSELNSQHDAWRLVICVFEVYIAAKSFSFFFLFTILLSQLQCGNKNVKEKILFRGITVCIELINRIWRVSAAGCVEKWKFSQGISHLYRFCCEKLPKITRYDFRYLNRLLNNSRYRWSGMENKKQKFKFKTKIFHFYAIIPKNWNWNRYIENWNRSESWIGFQFLKCSVFH